MVVSLGSLGRLGGPGYDSHLYPPPEPSTSRGSVGSCLWSAPRRRALGAPSSTQGCSGRAAFPPVPGPLLACLARSLSLGFPAIVGMGGGGAGSGSCDPQAGGGGDILAESPAGVLWARMAARGRSTNTLDVGVIPTPGCLPGLGRGLTRIPSLPRKGRRAPFTGHTLAQVGNAEPFPRAGCWWRARRESGDSKPRSPGTSGILDT